MRRLPLTLTFAACLLMTVAPPAMPAQQREGEQQADLAHHREQ